MAKKKVEHRERHEERREAFDPSRYGDPSLVKGWTKPEKVPAYDDERRKPNAEDLERLAGMMSPEEIARLAEIKKNQG